MTQQPALRLVRELYFATDGKAPDWIELLPAGARVEAGDGRWFANTDPDGVVARFKEHFIDRGIDMVVDYEHATEIDVTAGHPAAGWIDAVENRDGAIFGHVTWTDKARAMIEGREYRFMSPVMLHDPKTKQVFELTSAALTHNPALSMRSLASRQTTPQPDPSGDPAMNEATRKALCTALDLKPEASDDSILTSVNEIKDAKVKALASANTPPIDKFVPRADHDKIKGDLETAQARLADIDRTAVETKVDDAIKAGKIAPASRDYHLAACRNDPAAFDAFVEAAPKMPVTEGSDLDGKTPAAPGAGNGLTAEDKALCRDLGITEDEYAKTAA